MCSPRTSHFSPFGVFTDVFCLCLLIVVSCVLILDTLILFLLELCLDSEDGGYNMAKVVIQLCWLYVKSYFSGEVSATECFSNSERKKSRAGRFSPQAFLLFFFRISAPNHFSLLGLSIFDMISEFDTNSIQNQWARVEGSDSFN